MNEGREAGGSVVECLEWNAWYNRELPEPSDDRLHVAGRVRCNSGDIKLKLQPTNEGIVDDPELFVLEFSFSGGLITDDVVVLDVDWADSVGDSIKQVEIRGACQAAVPVVIVT